VPGLTQQLAEFIAGLEFAQLPAEAVATVKRGTMDCVGVLFAGRGEPVVRILLKHLSAGNEASVLFESRKASSEHAALINAAAAHALDYDDTGLDGHPSVVLVPTLLAEGERLGAPGRELIAAYVAGYETWAELISRDADKHHGKGWHPSAVFGPVAAAAAAARLARLDAGMTANAIAMAASMGGGLVANFGSMTKPFQVGRAAQSGIQAARLAAAGMSASPDALEHPGGFLAALSPKGSVRLDGNMGKWHILRHGLSIKRYPVCYALHRAIDAALELASRPELVADRISGIEVTLGRHQAAMLRHHAPQKALDAKFSAEFAMAAALFARRVGLAELSDTFVRSEPIQSLMPKVRVVSVDAADPEEPLFSPFDTVRVTLTDGGVLASERVHHAKGHAKNPLDLDELRAKFNDCIADALSAARRNTLFNRLNTLESLPGVAELYE